MLRSASFGVGAVAGGLVGAVLGMALARTGHEGRVVNITEGANNERSLRERIRWPGIPYKEMRDLGWFETIPDDEDTTFVKIVFEPKEGRIELVLCLSPPDASVSTYIEGVKLQLMRR